MVDHIKFYTTGSNFPSGIEDGKPFVYFDDILFSPLYSDEGKITAYKGIFKNFKLVWYVSNRLCFENSMHKFSKSNNHSVFTWEELKNVITEIHLKFNIRQEYFVITRLEFALNFGSKYYDLSELRKYPYTTMERRTMFSKNMMDGNKAYGQKIYSTSIDFKIYDKSKEFFLSKKLPLEEDIVRVEIVFKDVSTLKFIRTLDHFFDGEVMLKLYHRLLSYFLEIKTPKLCENNASILGNKDLKLFYAGSNDNYWVTLKKKSKDSFKYERKGYNRILASLKVEDSWNEIEEKFISEIRKVFWDFYDL